jgi:hypothetical protein
MMDISKARRLVELEKEGQKVLVTLWDGDKITCCQTTSEARSSCESCQGDEQICEEYIDYLKEKGFKVTEIELADLDFAGSLPSFLEMTKGGSHAEALGVENLPESERALPEG